MSDNVLSIKLEIGGKEKIFVASKVKGRMVRKAMEFASMNTSNLDVSALDGLVGYVVELFDNKFSIDEVYDGLEADKLMPTILECIQGVTSQFASKASENPNA